MTNRVFLDWSHWSAGSRGSVATMTQRDSDRSSVYAVEDQWGQILDRGGDLDFFGSRLHLPKQRVLLELAAIQHYVDDLLSQCAGDQSVPVQVRHRRGVTRAHYEPRPLAAIAIPIGVAWACREVVILHELAHHLRYHSASGSLHHDEEFRGHLVALAGHALGPEAAFVLRAGYLGAGLGVEP